MVPLTIFQRLSALGSGGGVNAGTIPPFAASSQHCLVSNYQCENMHWRQTRIGMQCSGFALEQFWNATELWRAPKGAIFPDKNAMRFRSTPISETAITEPAHTC